MTLRNTYRAGDWLCVCQRCGFDDYASQIKREWTGLLVCRGCHDPRHPQEYVRGKADEQAVPFASPPGDPVFLAVGDVTRDDL